MPVLYLAPWVGYGGSDTGTIDWFKWIDRARYRPSLITTQPSTNERISEVEPYADEVWALPDLMWGNDFPDMILDFIYSRGIRIVHIMNSRIAFNLLPEIKRLPDPPATVVQLHVEEADRSGYVRYVTTRFGTLVDAFSVTSRQLADAVVGYGVPEAKCHVIYTGVDAEEAFSPELVQPIPLAGSARLEILFPARLVEQKDPLLMVEVAASMVEMGVDFRIHVVGDGMLEEALRAAVARRGLEAHVLLHGPSREIARWYAACDVLLMTSLFEGVPYAVYEAMAMGLPIVAPALAGNVELLAEADPPLVKDRSDPRAYAVLLSGLATDAERRAAIGASLRTRALGALSLRQMARNHGALYEELLPTATASVSGAASLPTSHSSAFRTQLRFSSRPVGRPLVSIIIPCFNHGVYLLECLESITRQTYAPLEIIVVDDGSTDPETLRILKGIRERDGVSLVRLERNAGPSAARNAGIAQARGRYFLPLDADNLLLPQAVQRLVEHIEGAGEAVGFIYPNQSFFGNRTDYARAPRYNRHALMSKNYCDTCSLVDREVFDAGLRYDETIGLGHEDWDFVLQMAEAGVVGEPARTATLLTRKAGFTRSDLVDIDPASFESSMRARHADLYAEELAIKARWSPAVSVVSLQPVDTAHACELESAALAQTLRDAELIIRHPQGRRRSGDGPVVRRLHADLAETRAEAAVQGISVARGRIVLLTNGTGLEFLQDRSLMEKLLRAMRTPGVAIALTDLGDSTLLPLTRLPVEDVQSFRPFGIAWSRMWAEAAKVTLAHLSQTDPVADIATLLMRHTLVEWRHLAGGGLPTDRRVGGEAPRLHVAAINLAGCTGSETDDLERKVRVAAEPMLPRRVGGRRSRTWRPPQTLWLYRHLDPRTGERRISLDRSPPPGMGREYRIGAISKAPLQGTVPLYEPDRERVPRPVGEPGSGRLLGYLETAPLPLLDPVFVAETPEGWTTLVSGEDDPLMGHARLVEALGFIEPAPQRPRRAEATPMQTVLAVLAERAVTGAEALRAIDAERERANQLQLRLDRVLASFPARVYRRVKRLPGMARVVAMVLRRPNQ